jgi:sugar/nucleoside kinase (ribokinase family)
MGIGAATLDDLWVVTDFSDHECVKQAHDHLFMGGGPVATALCVLACLGHAVALVDVCGDDATGDSIVADLEKHGVSTTMIRREAGARSARAVVLVRSGDGARQIVFQPSSAGEPVIDGAMKRKIRWARLLHLNGRHESTAREAVKVAQEAGVMISFDGGAGRYRDSIRDLVEASQVVIVSRDFAQQMTGKVEMKELMECLFQPPAQVVVITDGMHGSHAMCADGRLHHQPAFEAIPLLDTTGCGDVYHGAFLHGWLSGWNLPECARFAARLAAKNAEGFGGRYVCLSGGASVAR